MTESRKTGSAGSAAEGSQAPQDATDNAPAPETAPSTAEVPSDRLSELEEALENARQEAQSNYDRLLRVTAEFENYKKRAVRESAEFRKFANENLIKAMLPVVDSLELAIESSSQDEKSNSQVVHGVTLTLTELAKVLEKFGVKAVEAKGKPFDPNFHQAFMQETADDLPENTVIKEFQKGYLLHDRLIRPAMVIVSKKTDADAGKSAGNSGKQA
jgi:molecular chaperone GrpE